MRNDIRKSVIGWMIAFGVLKIRFSLNRLKHLSCHRLGHSLRYHTYDILTFSQIKYSTKKKKNTTNRTTFATSTDPYIQSMRGSTHSTEKARAYQFTLTDKTDHLPCVSNSPFSFFLFYFSLCLSLTCKVISFR